MIKRKDYISPTVKTVVFKVEKGFDNSCYNTQHNPDLEIRVSDNSGSSLLEGYTTQSDNNIFH
ncbi:MAG: hypothetical protein MJZ86_01525 [Bacteroidales bacterium]|nr:hypothetical protein [Bacteroidales bacterium]